MSRKAWMLPKEETIDRRLVRKAQRAAGRPASARRSGGRASRPAMLLACVAVALVVSGAVVLSAGRGNETTALPPVIPGSSADIPVPPFSIYGYTYDENGALLPDCTVTLTNVNTSESVVFDSGAAAFYMKDLTELELGYTNGDVFHVEAVKGELWGENNTVIDFESPLPYIQLDITLEGEVIPEFSTVLIPVAGVLVLFAIVGLRRRKAEE